MNLNTTEDCCHSKWHFPLLFKEIIAIEHRDDVMMMMSTNIKSYQQASCFCNQRAHNLHTAASRTIFPVSTGWILFFPDSSLSTWYLKWIQATQENAELCEPSGCQAHSVALDSSAPSECIDFRMIWEGAECRKESDWGRRALRVVLSAST